MDANFRKKQYRGTNKACCNHNQIGDAGMMTAGAKVGGKGTKTVNPARNGEGDPIRTDISSLPSRSCENHQSDDD